jgi:glucose/arabinose dehydrogenase
MRIPRSLFVAACMLQAFSSFAADALKPVTVAQGLVNPWSLAFLPDGRMLVTERPGRLRIVEADGRIGAPLAGLPDISVGGQCGLLDVALDPKFADNGFIYFSYAEPAGGGDGGNSTAVARARLSGAALGDVRTIFRQAPKFASNAHCGGRLVFARDGRLFLTLGDRFARKDDAQTLDNHHGKVVRIEPDGQVPKDNPFVRPRRCAARDLEPRAPQRAGRRAASRHGRAVDPRARPAGWRRGQCRRGRPQLRLAAAHVRRNYGTGTRIGDEGPEARLRTAAEGVGAVDRAERHGVSHQRPLPRLEGQLFVGALRAEVLVRLTLDGRKVQRRGRLLADLKERIRDVRQGPDGWLYLLTDSATGRILRLER